MAVDSLQKLFRTLSDPTRLRIWALLAREELAVQELMEVLGMAQSRVSRHLAILREAGLLRDRREGTHVFYRAVPAGEGERGEVLRLVGRTLRDDATGARDAAALGRVIEARAERSRSFFESVGPEWDALRKVFHDDLLRARAVTRLVPPGLHVADVGTGTGVLALELARLGCRVVAVDHSERMLEAARAKLEAEGVSGVELRLGEASRLPLADGEVDACLAHMVLHYLPSPAEALAEMARVLRPGGVLVVVDFVRHDCEWMRAELGVLWLGFEPAELEGDLAAAGLAGARVEVQPSPSRGGELPDTFIARARRAPAAARGAAGSPGKEQP
jgi:ArsR family transcriptional regulator